VSGQVGRGENRSQRTADAAPSGVDYFRHGQDRFIDLTRTTLAVAFLGILIAACFWSCCVPLVAAVAAMFVIAAMAVFYQVANPALGKRRLAV